MRRSRAGSVLIDALVALAILTLVMAGVAQVTRDSRARHRDIETRRAALMVARSQLAAVGLESPLTGGMAAGEQDGFIWRLEADLCNDAEGDSAAGRLHCVTVTVRPQNATGPVVVLASRRLAPEG
ncbi:hypothetical protein [Caulobacter endophyticus]|uniref:hypothetical protein n=1 Tax=Caulobacter endophyticus TaxID=2172652 RepID=UPI00240F70F8|nr:hypothetical protein [Caulobacter endophyticus]MDG2527273.1 hypothetical protein [Caulobacter endophyticus]